MAWNGFKKGASGNPNGRPKGAVSLKVFAKNYLKELSDEDKLEFLDALPPQTVWSMAEGNPDNKVVAEVKQTEFTTEEIEAAKHVIIDKLNAKQLNSGNNTAGN